MKLATSDDKFMIGCFLISVIISLLAGDFTGAFGMSTAIVTACMYIFIDKPKWIEYGRKQALRVDTK